MSAGLNEADFAPLEAEPRRRGWIWLVYLALYVLAIPWYWPENYRGPLVLGLPLWVACTLGAMVLLAVWTAWVIFYCWQDREGID